MKGRLLERREVDAATHRAMLRLMDRWFEGVTAERFAVDLETKTHAILLEEGDRLLGFSTLAVEPVRWRSDPYCVVCSGDTVVDPSAWGRSILPAFWIDAVWSLHAIHGGHPVWLLLTSGFRTYRFLPVFWREFHPRWDAEMPKDVRALRDCLTGRRYGEAYDPDAGIVRFPEPQRLREPLVGIPEERLDNPHVAFFAEANPGHARGDELVCLTDLTAENLTPAGERMVRAGAKLRGEET